MRKNKWYLVLLIIASGIFLFTSLYVSTLVTPGPNVPYIIKNIFQFGSIVMVGVLSTLLHRNCKKKE